MTLTSLSLSWLLSLIASCLKRGKQLKAISIRASVVDSKELDMSKPLSIKKYALILALSDVLALALVTLPLYSPALTACPSYYLTLAIVLYLLKRR